MSNALRLNAERRAVKFAEGQQLGMQWMLECRDMWDAHDDDAGVYFRFCMTEAEVKTAVSELSGENGGDRLLGIYDLSKPLEPQGAGLKEL